MTLTGNQVTDIDTLLDVENALVVEVNQLTPGSLRVDVHSEGPHTLRVTGQSSASYVVGISPKHIIYVNGTKGEQLTSKEAFMKLCILLYPFHIPEAHDHNAHLYIQQWVS